jgi:hypothetical protein
LRQWAADIATAIWPREAFAGVAQFCVPWQVARSILERIGRPHVGVNRAVGALGQGGMPDDDRVPLDQGGMIGFYRRLADACLEAADASADPATRDDWIRLANKWTHLALYANRMLDLAARKGENP